MLWNADVVIEAARNLLKIKNASTSEFCNNCTSGWIVRGVEKKEKRKLKEQKKLGGTMRLGLYDAILKIIL